MRSKNRKLQMANSRGSHTLYAIGFRFYFTPLTAVLFTVPSRYWFTIGCQRVFSLIQWSGRIHAEFHVHRITWDTSRGIPSNAVHVKLCMNPSRPLDKAKYSLATDSELVPRGKGEKNPC